MIVTFVSQCEKNALSKTRQVLDAFANRIGDKAWQTVITQEGLDTIQRQLRKTASKNTAVACHRSRGYSRTELVWIVGNRKKFSVEGYVPVNTTQKKVTEREDHWQFMPLIRALTALAALFHDWGKATACFQDKLAASCTPPKKGRANQTPSRYQGDPLRHEWISCLLLSAFVHLGSETPSDQEWLIRLENAALDEALLKEQLKPTVNTPLAHLPPAASLVAWLVLSHHRLPLQADKNKNSHFKTESVHHFQDLFALLTAEFGYQNKFADYEQRVASCFTFPQGLLSQSQPWLKQLRRWASKLRKELTELDKSLNNGSWRLILHHCRLALMLGDHFYSSQDESKDIQWQHTLSLYANTQQTKEGDKTNTKLKQKLDEHLVCVAQNALEIASLLPSFETVLPYAEDVRRLKKQSQGAFIWQDKAVKELKSWRAQLPGNQLIEKTGFFAVNMASTGCGKTVANAKVMRALSPNYDKLRYILALGLRTLTLQTGDEYRARVGLDKTQMAVLIGSKAVMNLHEHHKHELHQEEADAFAVSGSESQSDLLDGDIEYEAAIPEERLSTLFSPRSNHRHKAELSKKNQQFLYAPVLVCTIDHIMAATETKRGGRYILPCLRLMSSDLVIDEIDDFNGPDLVAIGRLIHLAGMLGRKVMISSATIPPALAEGYLNAYREGWLLYSQAHHLSSDIGCAWIDEFKTQVTTLKVQDTLTALNQYRADHQQFITKRVAKLSNPAKTPVRRKGWIVPCDDLKQDKSTSETLEDRYFERIRETIITLHQHHAATDSRSGKQVSFGVVRMANVDPCIRLTKYLIKADWETDIDPKLMAYHSRQILLLRSHQEQHLDQVLKRKEKLGNDPVAFENPIIRQHIDHSDAQHIVFIVVATPVEEVGRDHDFDWAVIEPSSYRSIVQLAGRVLRHRQLSVTSPNVALLQYNLKALNGAEIAYCRPGYEGKHYSLQSHDLNNLLADCSITTKIDAIPRIQPNPSLQPKLRLADLEHAVMQKGLTDYSAIGAHTLQGYLTQTWWMTAMPQYFNAFRNDTAATNLYYTWEQTSEEWRFHEKDKGELILRQTHYQIQTDRPTAWASYRHRFWLARDYTELLTHMAEAQKQPMNRMAQTYGELSLPQYGNQESNPPSDYLYSDQFGLETLS